MTRPRLTFVEERDGEIAGEGTLSWSTRHPDVVAATLDVHEPFRRKGLGSALLHRLAAEAGESRLMFNIEPNPAAAVFLSQAGFEVVATSETRRLDVAEVLPSLDDAPLADVAFEAAPAFTEDMVDLYERAYAHCHRWAGRYDAPDDQPWIGFAGPLIDVAGSIQIASIDDVPIAIASLHSGSFAEGSDAFVPPTTVMHPFELDERSAVLRCVIGRLLRAADDAGLSFVLVEFDSPYDDLAAVIGGLPSSPVSEREMWRVGGRLLSVSSS